MGGLQKAIAHVGATSRRKAEELIVKGRVEVNGQVVRELGTQASEQDIVGADDVPIYQGEYGYYLFYKPRGVISAVSNDKSRKVVTDYFTDVTERIYPVGRLDYGTSGLLPLTNDGNFSQKLTHLKHEVDKIYVVEIKGVPTKQDLLSLVKDVRIDGKCIAPANFQILSVDIKTGSSVVELTIREGRNHQVKKMSQAVGFPIQKLKREYYGELTSQGLRSGQYHDLVRKEISQLLNQVKQDKTTRSFRAYGEGIAFFEKRNNQ